VLFRSSTDGIDTGTVPRTSYEIARADERAGNIAAAERLYRRIIAKNGEHTSAWISLSELRAKRGGEHAAIQILEKARVRNPLNIRILRELVKVYHAVGNPEKCAKYGKKIAELACGQEGGK
jgi:lipopolysaccharide biosynthesis regulator YciM